MWFELFREFLHDIKTHRTRAILTLIAITWGTVAVVLLLSFGEGLGNQMLKGLTNAGNRILIVYGGQTSLTYEGLPKGRRIRLVEEDLSILRQVIPAIDMVSPQYRKNVQRQYGKVSVTTECEGVNPDFEEMRRMYPAGGGRFLNMVDINLQRRVLFLGEEIAEEIFQSEERLRSP